MGPPGLGKREGTRVTQSETKRKSENDNERDQGIKRGCAILVMHSDISTVDSQRG